MEDVKPHPLLHSDEIFWMRHSKWLEHCGYRLRSRFQPGWVPPWEGTNKIALDFEEGFFFSLATVLDAVHIPDGKRLALKLVDKTKHPYEQEIGQFLSSPALAGDSRNHCIPLIEVLTVPDNSNLIILVMPRLRRFESPKFLTVGECISFFIQIFEGLQFMHIHHVAHRDTQYVNIMMDASCLYPKGFHPVIDTEAENFKGRARHSTRTETSPKYYLIDFGLSRRYDADNLEPREPPIRGGDRTAPEHQGDLYQIPCNPFRTDIYYLGHTIEEQFLKRWRNLEFMRPLIEDMMHVDPAERPNMDQVISRFNQAITGMTKWQLRARLVWQNPLEDYKLVRILMGIPHFFRTTRFLIKRCPPIPLPRA